MSAHIIVVDDDPDSAFVIVEMLRRLGYKANSLTPGPRLLKELAELGRGGEVDLIITDLFMPEPDGFEIIRFARLALAGVPVIGMSGRHRGLLGSMLAFGATHAIEKPVHPRELKTVVEEALKLAIDYI